MPWYCYIAFKQLFPSGKFFSLFSLLSIVGVALGVWMLSVVQSVMSGFGEDIHDKLADTGGHIQIRPESGGGTVYDYGPLIDLAKTVPETEVAVPYIEDRAMIQFRNRPSLPTVRSFLTEGDVVPLQEFLIIGDLNAFHGDAIILSVSLASSIGVSMDSVIDMYTPNVSEEYGDEEANYLREMKVVGIVETGYGKVDVNSVFIPLDTMQELYGLSDGVHGITLRLSERNLAPAAAAVLNEQLPEGFKAFSWLDNNKDLLFILRLEKTMMFLIIIVISVVAAFAIVISLFTTVIRKKREIGIYRALGGIASDVAKVFCVQGLVIGILGSFLGVVSAVISLHYRNEIMQFLIFLTNFFKRLFMGEDEMGYNPFPDLPSYYTLSDFLIFAAIAIVLSTLAGLLPARYASRLKPAETLRSE